MDIENIEELETETFKDTAKSFSPKCSINNKGVIGFNDGSKREYKLANFEFAVMHYNKEHLIIFIEPTNDKTKEGAIRIRKGKKHGAFLAAKNFFLYYRNAPNKTTIYKPYFSDKKKMIIIELNKGKERRSIDIV